MCNTNCKKKDLLQHKSLHHGFICLSVIKSKKLRPPRCFKLHVRSQEYMYGHILNKDNWGNFPIAPPL